MSALQNQVARYIGTAAALFDGSGDYISSDSSTDFDFQTAGDWTIEFWVKPTSVAAGTDAFIYSGASGGGANFQISRNGTNIVIDNGSVASINASAGFTTGWQHVAVCRESGTVRAYVGGVQKVSAAAQTYTGGAQVMTIGRFRAGASGVSDLNGRIDDLRITKGTAVYPGGTTFTPPTAAFSSSPANATIVTTSQTADATVDHARVLLEIDPIDSITLGTDLTIEVTCNGGTNWTAAGSYTNCGKGQSGRTVVETDDVTCTSGTSFAARIKTLNNKSVSIYKAAVVVH